MALLFANYQKISEDRTWRPPSTACFIKTSNQGFIWNTDKLIQSGQLLHLPFSSSKVLRVKFRGWLCRTQPTVWAHQCLLLLPAELIAYPGKTGNPVRLMFLAQKDLEQYSYYPGNCYTSTVTLQNRCSNLLEKSAKSILKFLFMYG